ncbi:MAG: hypothetical protein H6835_05580 [Planctomycetes bacterium]|nr:hypothetical protein [Planctomycetota bacterium]
MRLPDDVPQQLGVLALCGDPQPMHALLVHLRQAGLQVDAVRNLADARSTFFGAGGHDCLVIGPDVAPGLASRVAASLASVDPALALATFGPKLGDSRAAARTARLGAFHPSSRAGQGALLRFLRSLSRR